MQGPDAAGHASYLFCNEHVASIKVLAEHIKWGQSCGYSVTRVRLLEYRGGLLCWYSLPSTRHNSRCRPEITNETCHQKDHTRSTLHGDWVRSLGHWSLLILRIPMPPCTCTATTHLDTKRSSSHRRCSRHGMWCLLILNYGMRSDVGQCMIHGHQVDKP